MSLCLTVALLLANKIDVGGYVGIALPAGGLSRYHASATALAAQFGWTTSCQENEPAGKRARQLRLEASYSYTDIPGRPVGAYRLTMHTPELGIGLELLGSRAWGVELSAGAGLSFIRRVAGAAIETGHTPVASLAAGFVQREGHSRLNIIFVNTIFVELPGHRVTLTWIPQLRAGVTYVL